MSSRKDRGGQGQPSLEGGQCYWNFLVDSALPSDQVQNEPQLMLNHSTLKNRKDSQQGARQLPQAAVPMTHLALYVNGISRETRSKLCSALRKLMEGRLYDLLNKFPAPSSWYITNV